MTQAPNGPRFLRWGWLVAGCLLLLMVGLALSAATRTSLTYDEHTYIPAGYSYWTKHDLRVNREHPPLTKLVAALPLLPLDLSTGKSDRVFETLPSTGTTMGQWTFGETFLFKDNLEQLPQIIFRSRAVMLLFPLLLGLGVYLWARDLFGEVGALVSLAVCATNPDILGHGALATNDVPLATFYFWTVLLAWRYLKAPATPWLLGLSTCLGLALACKFTGVLLLPVLGVLWAAALLDPALVSDGSPRIQNPLGRGKFLPRAMYSAGSLAGGVAGGALVLWAGYLFLESPKSYWDGLQLTYTLVHDDFAAFLFGQYRVGGFWNYYLAALFYKLPLGTQALLLFAVVQLWRRRAALFERKSTLRFTALCLLVPVVSLLVLVSWKTAQIGHRYAFGAYGFLFVAAGSIGPTLVQAAASLVQEGKKLSAVATLVGALGLVAHSALTGALAYPFYISFANSLVSSPKEFLFMFDMATVDWKQGWKEVARLQKRGDLPTVAMYIPGRLPTSMRVYGIRHVPYNISSESPAPGTYIFSSNDFFRSQRSNRLRKVHVPILEDFPFEVIAGCVVAVNVDERLPPLPSPLPVQLEVKYDSQGRTLWEREAYVAPDGKKTPHGKYTVYKEDGRKESGEYRMGVLHGAYTRNHKNGKVAEIGTLWLGELHGTAVSFDEQGHSVGKWEYFAGKKVPNETKVLGAVKGSD